MCVSFWEECIKYGIVPKVHSQKENVIVMWTLHVQWMPQIQYGLFSVWLNKFCNISYLNCKANASNLSGNSNFIRLICGDSVAKAKDFEMKQTWSWLVDMWGQENE